jgi:integrase
MATKTRGKGENSVYFDDKRKLWTAIIELPTHDGTRRRKWVRRKIKSELMAELKRLVIDLETRGDLPTTDMTVERWMTYWVEEIAAKAVRPKTAANYRNFTYRHIIPTIGTTRLSQVNATHVRRVTDRITGELGLTGETALTAHRIMSVSFETAVRENRIGRNPAKLLDAPRRDVPKLEVLTRDESLTVLAHVAHDQQYGARWATALLTGARRGEVLGLTRDRVTDVLDLSWQLQRLTWSHGCDPGCKFTRAASCPWRRLDVPRDYEYRHIEGGLYFTRPKSRAGWRIIPLVDPLKSILEKHMAENEPGPQDLLFTTKAGAAVDPDRDSQEWRSVLAASGIDKNVRLHDLRHTAVDMLYLAGVPEDLIVQIVGHSSRTMTRAYASRGNIGRLTEAMNLMSALYSPTPAAQITA